MTTTGTPDRSVSADRNVTGGAGRAVRLAAVCDAVAVGAFVAIGRSSHDEGGAFVGWASTVWPFLVGAAAGWLVVRAWRRPVSPVPTALGVWVSTVVVGMGLRAVTGQGTAASFVIVATLFLAATLFGWRLVYAAVRRRRSLARRSTVDP